VIRYSYQTQLQPPAPFVYVTLRNPLTGAEQRDIPAQIDSAADRTVLPDTIIQALALPQIGTIAIAGVGGIIQNMPSYPVEIGIQTLPARLAEIVGSAGELWVLLGRDILNAHTLLLAGPQSFLEVG
jgi:hypothetical protein